MSLNDTPSAERTHISFFGLRNAGKSSVVNAVTGQCLSLVSNIKGTTTDPVKKAMEILPIGPVVIIDTPGIDDKGELGEMRVKKAFDTLSKTDIAVLVVDGIEGMKNQDNELTEMFKQKNIPYIVAFNKCDMLDEIPKVTENTIYISAKTNVNIFELKEMMAHLVSNKNEKMFISDIVKEEDIVVLVTPIDESAPKGRMILPQQQTIRAILDCGAINVVTKVETLDLTIKSLSKKPKLVITDSQAFEKVMKIVPEDIMLTSFSMLFARYKGNLFELAMGAKAIDGLCNGDKVLISEACTHHRQCNDIGTVKLPKWLTNHTKKKFDFEFSSGNSFPDDLSEFSLIIHCGGCMINEREMASRLDKAKEQNIPITNYGTAIAHMNGILNRAIEPFK